MGCTHEWGQVLSKYVDDEASPEERGRVEDHLSGCAECRDMLSLFRRNESVLDNSLAGEAFGSQLVESVMAELRRRELPPVIAPEVSGTALSRAWAWVAARGWPLSAAAAFLVATAALLLRPNDGEELRAAADRLARENRRLVQTVEQIRDLNQATSDDLISRLDEQEQELSILKAALQAPPDQTYGIVLRRRGIEVGIRVRELAMFSSFDLERSEDGGRNWQKIATGLSNPSYTDLKATPGQAYDYRFTGTRRDGTIDAPMPPAVGLRLPAGDQADPETHIDLKFIAATPANDQATFQLSRRMAGVDHKTFVIVKPGSMIGERVRSGDRDIDFSTGLMLEKLGDFDQVMVTGVVGNRPQLFSRANVRATLKRVGGSSAPVQVWREDSVWVPAPK